MADGIIPAQEVLREILDYNPATGALHHKERPSKMFASARDARSWNSKHAGKSAISRIDHEGYARVCLFGSRCRAHRVIWKLVHGEEPRVIDHINGDVADNRIVNLRNVDFTANCRNRRLSGTNSSGVSGVHWCAKHQRWVSRIGAGGERRLLGTYRTKDEAVTARRRAEAELGYVRRA